MKTTVLMKKIFALCFITAVVLPLTSSVGAFNKLSDDVYADSTTNTVTTVSAETEEPETPIPTYKYVFEMGDELMSDVVVNANNDGKVTGNNIYDYENDIYRNNFKVKSAKDTTLAECGTLDNPYVVMEVTQGLRSTQLRCIVGDQGIYALTKSEIDAMTLTEDEITAVKLFTLSELYNAESGEAGSNYLFSKLNEVYADRDSYNNRIEELAGNFANFDEEFNANKAYALEYKKTAEKSQIYYNEAVAASIRQTIDYIWTYKVENGKFVTFNKSYTSGSTEKENLYYATAGYGGSTSTNYFKGEYKVTKANFNMLFNGYGSAWLLGGGRYNTNLFKSSRAFTKGCLDLGYETLYDENGIMISKEPYVDQYIFSGWAIERDGKLVPIDGSTGEAVATNEEILSADKLYTTWSIRYFETTEFTTTRNGTFGYELESADWTAVKVGDYDVMIPSDVASVKLAGEAAVGVHNPKTQLSFYIPVSEKIIVDRRLGGNYNLELEHVNYAKQISGYDFEIKKDDLQNGSSPAREALEQIAPALMSDVDYRVNTYNYVIDKDGVIHFYPYSVKVITLTYEDLNNMVEYDYRENGWSHDEYHESEYLNKFLDNIDFIYLYNGENCLIGSENAGRYDHFSLLSGNSQTENLIPKQERFPTTYTAAGSYDASKFTMDSFDSSVDKMHEDMEWQVAWKIYNRALSYDQKRRVCFILTKRLLDAGFASNGDCNLSKLMFLMTINIEPAETYDYYVSRDEYTEFDKIVATTRDGGEFKGTYFTGAFQENSKLGTNDGIYGKKWNVGLFFPFELVGVNHREGAEDGNLKGYSFWNGNAALWHALGFDANPFGAEQVANRYMYTFNGGTELSQAFLSYTIPYSYTGWNTSGVKNTYQVFDYFVVYRVPEIHPPFDEDGNYYTGRISPKTCIEFMIQQTSAPKEKEKKSSISILSEPTLAKLSANATYRKKVIDKIAVDVIEMEDTTSIQNIYYQFETEANGKYYVVEYLLTPRFQDIDALYGKMAKFRYAQWTTTTDNSAKWIKLSKTNNTSVTIPDMGGHFKTYEATLGLKPNDLGGFSQYIITKMVNSDADGNEITTHKVGPYEIKQYTEAVKNRYGFDAVVSPAINGSSQSPYYIIAVKEYASKTAFLSTPDAPTSMTLHNVVITKFKKLFYLD